MINGDTRVRVVVYNRPVDMRKPLQGLRAMIQQVLNEDQPSVHWFVFINSRDKCLKLQ